MQGLAKRLLGCGRDSEMPIARALVELHRPFVLRDQVGGLCIGAFDQQSCALIVQGVVAPFAGADEAFDGFGEWLLIPPLQEFA
jgi:hypothetical protein